MNYFDLALPSRANFLVGALAVALIGILGLGTLIEVMYLLPSPGGDSVQFLRVSHTFCAWGFLGTDSARLPGDRFVWHGFLSPYFYGSSGLGCTPRSYYSLNAILKIATALLVLRVAREAGHARISGLALAILVVAAQAKVQFRPEALAIFIVFLAEWALLASRPVAFGIAEGLLCWCQPTVWGLYSLFVLLRKGSTLFNRSGWILGGFSVTFIVLSMLYPFPLVDLLTGLSNQARRLSGSGGAGEDSLDYYVATHFLPFWFALFLAAFAVCCRRTPWLLLMTPVLWWFGPRVPPTNYILISLLPVVVSVAMNAPGRRVSILFPAACLVVGLVGAAQGLVRDGLTIAQYGNSFAETSTLIDRDARSNDFTIGLLPSFVFLTNPSLSPTRRFVTQADPGARREGSVIDYFVVTGRPLSPCPLQTSSQTNSLSLFGRVIFNSNSGYGVYRCVRKPEKAADG